MVYVWKDYDDKVLTNVFKISFANFDTIEVYCYSDGKTYTLVR